MSTKCFNPVKGNSSFMKIINESKKFHSSSAIAFVCFKPCKPLAKNDINPEAVYIGVGISKKICKKAVVRNRVKRLLRESIRNGLKNYSESQFIHYIIVLWRKKVTKSKDLNLKIVTNEINELLRTVETKYQYSQQK